MKLPQESDMPSWTINLEIPLMETTVTAADLLEDSTFVGVPWGTSGDSIFAYQDETEIEKVEVGDQLNIDDIHQSFSQWIQIIPYLHKGSIHDNTHFHILFITA